MSQPLPAPMDAAAIQGRLLLLLLTRDGTPMGLVQAVQRHIQTLAHRAHIEVITPEAPPADVPHEALLPASELLASCHAQLPCIAGQAARVHAQAAVIARAMPSKVASNGLVMQFLVIGAQSEALERKCGLEIGSVDEIDTAVRAIYLALMGQALAPPYTPVGPLTSRQDMLQRLRGHLDALTLTFATLQPTTPTEQDLALLNDTVEALEGTVSAASRWMQESSVPSSTASALPAAAESERAPGP